MRLGDSGLKEQTARICRSDSCQRTMRLDMTIPMSTLDSFLTKSGPQGGLFSGGNNHQPRPKTHQHAHQNTSPNASPPPNGHPSHRVSPRRGTSSCHHAELAPCPSGSTAEAWPRSVAWPEPAEPTRGRTRNERVNDTNRETPVKPRNVFRHTSEPLVNGWQMAKGNVMAMVMSVITKIRPPQSRTTPHTSHHCCSSKTRPSFSPTLMCLPFQGMFAPDPAA